MIAQVYNHRVLLLCVILAVATFVVYLPVRNHEFVRYDDDVYVTKNQNVQSGLSWRGVKWAFTTRQGSNWHPLTWLSHQLDCTLFDQKAGYHHLVNVLFHVANTILLLIVFNRMTGRLWPSAVVAALFALHPLHVESVAWVAERKDVLSTFFWFMTMLAYAHYAEHPSAGRYIATVVLFALGLMAKPMLVTVPFVLLLLDYWPLNRFAGSKRSISFVLLEKIPLLLLSATSSVITFIVQQKGGAMSVAARLPFRNRFVNAFCSYLAYIGKMTWPGRLAVLYPHPVGTIPIARAFIFAGILVLITALVLYNVRRHKYLLVGWFWYLGTLVPVIGIIQVGTQAMADRYTYIPLTGLFIIIAFGVPDLLIKVPFKKILLTFSAVVVLVACAIVTSNQLRYWKDSVSLFEHTLVVIENSHVMQNNYANILSELGEPDKAAEQFTKLLKSRPNSPEIHNNFGNALRDLARYDEAITHYKIALQLKPNFPLARYNLGQTYVKLGRYDEAIEQYKLYLGPDVNIAQLHQDLAQNLVEQGKVEDAVGQFQKALVASPDSVEVLSNFGYALAQSGHPDTALDYYNQALKIDPDDIITHGRLALALAALGRLDEAITQCRIVLAERPNDYEMHTNLGILLETKGLLDQAAQSYKKALEINPSFQTAGNKLSALTQRKNPQIETQNPNIVP